MRTALSKCVCVCVCVFELGVNAFVLVVGVPWPEEDSTSWHQLLPPLQKQPKAKWSPSKTAAATCYSLRLAQPNFTLFLCIPLNIFSLSSGRISSFVICFFSCEMLARDPNSPIGANSQPPCWEVWVSFECRGSVGSKPMFIERYSMVSWNAYQMSQTASSNITSGKQVNYVRELDHYLSSSSLVWYDR